MKSILHIIKGGSGMEFSIKEIISIIRKRFILLTVCTFAGLGLLFTVSKFMMNPTYTAAVQMYVNSKDTAASADLNDLYYAQKVVNTYISFLQTKVFYQRILEETKLNYTAEQLHGMTRINAVNNTEIFQISVTANSAEESYELAAAMQRVAPELIKNIKASAQISVVDPVTLPEVPSGPRVMRNSAAGAMVGFFLSLGAVFLWELIDVNVKNSAELKQRYYRPILGEIPSYGELERKRPLVYKMLVRRKKRSRKNLTAEEDHRFMINESYRALRTNLRYTMNKESCKKILINSPVPMDGKSTVCANLGITIAQTGAKVLLLDCDLRRGRLHQLFHVKSNPGVSEILSGIAKDRELIQSTAYENLHVITMGSIPPNPTELLMGNSMEELLKNQEKNYDYIIIDSPPVNIVADALGLVKLVDGIIVIVRESITSHPNIAGAMTKYELVGANILGFVLNGITTHMDGTSKSQYYSYHRQT